MRKYQASEVTYHVAGVALEAVVHEAEGNGGLVGADNGPLALGSAMPCLQHATYSVVADHTAVEGVEAAVLVVGHLGGDAVNRERAIADAVGVTAAVSGCISKTRQ